MRIEATSKEVGMNVNELLDRLREEPDAFAAVWEVEALRHGRGSLVFLPAREESEGINGMDCEFWTLDDIRARLRDLGVEDEFPLRWLLECDANYGLPVIIISPLPQTGYVKLCFRRLNRASPLN